MLDAVFATEPRSIGFKKSPAYGWRKILDELISRPQILFERHMFRKYTNGRFDGAAPDVSGPAGGYGLLSEQYTKLEKALSLCAKAKLGSEPALKSASWRMSPSAVRQQGQAFYSRES